MAKVRFLREIDDGGLTYVLIKTRGLDCASDFLHLHLLALHDLNSGILSFVCKTSQHESLLISLLVEIKSHVFHFF